MKKSKTSPAVSTTPNQQSSAEASGAIPLSQFLDSKAALTIQSINPWFSKLQDWSKVYLEIAKSERDVRNFKVSEKYSALAVIWAQRALQIKDLKTPEAITLVRGWVDEMKTPDLPETSNYYLAQDVYAKIYLTRDKLGNFKSRFCLISHGVPFVSSMAYLSLAIDLYKQTNYSKALFKIQNSIASIEFVKPEDDAKCDEREDTDNDTFRSKQSD